MSQSSQSNAIEITVEIVSAYVSNNSLPRTDLPDLIGTIHAALIRLDAGRPKEVVAVETTTQTAAAIRKSITPDYLICFEDGKKFKSMRRHLANLGMTPEQYREKYGLPDTYPMVSPNYAAKRSSLAKQTGLGQLINVRRRVKKAISQTKNAPAPTLGRAPGEPILKDGGASTFLPAREKRKRGRPRLDGATASGRPSSVSKEA